MTYQLLGLILWPLVTIAFVISFGYLLIRLITRKGKNESLWMFGFGVLTGGVIEYILGLVFLVHSMIPITDYIFNIVLPLPLFLTILIAFYLYFKKKPYAFFLGIILGIPLVFFGAGFFCLGC